MGTKLLVGASETAAILALTIGPTLLLLLLAVLLPHHLPSFDDDPRPVRLPSRLLFAGRSERAAIVLDCLTIPEGSPFTLELRVPDTSWFGERVEHLLEEWADESRELTLELRNDHGKVRTMISNGSSAVHLELAGAAGLALPA
ncbi:MAG: hypothetical protein QOF60_147 [Actinomycetota bacterium]|jgi:hypothetical protein|nr:hypothetical protein [Actinomycetota bacterium]